MFLCIQPIFYSTSVSSVTFWSTIKKKGHRSGFFATRGLNVQPRQAGSSLRAGFLRNNTALLYISKVRILLQVAMATGRMWRNPMLFNHVPGSGLKLSLFFNCVFIPWEHVFSFKRNLLKSTGTGVISSKVPDLVRTFWPTTIANLGQIELWDGIHIRFDRDGLNLRDPHWGSARL